jgi:hypothetical protein
LSLVTIGLRSEITLFTAAGTALLTMGGANLSSSSTRISGTARVRIGGIGAASTVADNANRMMDDRIVEIVRSCLAESAPRQRKIMSLNSP